MRWMVSAWLTLLQLPLIGEMKKLLDLFRGPSIGVGFEI